MIIHKILGGDLLARKASRYYMVDIGGDTLSLEVSNEQWTAATQPRRTPHQTTWHPRQVTVVPQF